MLNIGACTTAHRDPLDLESCLVSPFGDLQGSELCLFESRLVLNLRPGDLVVFPSSKITHFNLHMKGIRCSLVLQTDRGMARWSQDRGDWGGHMAQNTIE